MRSRRWLRFLENLSGCIRVGIFRCSAEAVAASSESARVRLCRFDSRKLSTHLLSAFRLVSRFAPTMRLTSSRLLPGRRTRGVCEFRLLARVGLATIPPNKALEHNCRPASPLRLVLVHSYSQCRPRSLSGGSGSAFLLGQSDEDSSVIAF